MQAIYIICLHILCIVRVYVEIQILLCVVRLQCVYRLFHSLNDDVYILAKENSSCHFLIHLRTYFNEKKIVILRLYKKNEWSERPLDLIMNHL